MKREELPNRMRPLDKITLETPSGFRFRTTLLSHGWIQLAPFRHDTHFDTLYRTQRVGRDRVVELRCTPAVDEAITVEISARARLSAEELNDVRSAAHRIFNLEIDLAPFYDVLEGASRYDWVCRYGGGRLLRAPTVWEDLAKTLLTTNTTWAMTRKMVERLTEIGPSGPGGHAFPTPEEVAALTPEQLADQVRAGYRNTYLHELAVEIAEEHIDVESWAGAEMGAKELFEAVRSLKGFGPYAAGATLKLLGCFDHLALDSAARTTFAAEFNGGARAPDGRIAEHYAPYGHWKGLVVWMDVMSDWFSEHTPATKRTHDDS